MLLSLKRKREKKSKQNELHRVRLCIQNIREFTAQLLNQSIPHSPASIETFHFYFSADATNNYYFVNHKQTIKHHVPWRMHIYTVDASTVRHSHTLSQRVKNENCHKWQKLKWQTRFECLYCTLLYVTVIW